MSVPVLSRWHWCGFYNTDELVSPLPCHSRTHFSNFTNMQVNIHLQFSLHEAVSLFLPVDIVTVLLTFFPLTTPRLFIVWVRIYFVTFDNETWSQQNTPFKVGHCRQEGVIGSKFCLKPAWQNKQNESVSCWYCEA